MDQILSVTADNASNNDTMISELGEILDEFPGASNQTRCFAHTINISAKAVLKQFDIPKKVDGKVLDEAARALANLAKDLDLEELAERESWEMDDSEEDQPLDIWVDFCEGLTQEQVTELDVSVQPVRSMLVKASSFHLTLTLHRLTQHQVAQARLRSQELHHQTPSNMVQHTHLPQPSSSNDAA